jgi:hypothetical protein
MPDDHPRRSGGGALFVLLFVVGFIAKFFWWIVAVLGAIVLFRLLLWLASYVSDRLDERDAKRAALVARADQQHAWVLAGDDRGVHGEYRPEVYPTGSG